MCEYVIDIFLAENEHKFCPRLSVLRFNFAPSNLCDPKWFLVIAFGDTSIAQAHERFRQHINNCHYKKRTLPLDKQPLRRLFFRSVSVLVGGVGVAVKREIDNKYPFLRVFANLCEFQQIYAPLIKLILQLAGARRKSPATSSICAGY